MEPYIYGIMLALLLTSGVTAFLGGIQSGRLWLAKRHIETLRAIIARMEAEQRRSS